MIKLKNLILEYYDDVAYDIYEMTDIIRYKLLYDFLYKNNDQMTKHIPWDVINFNELKFIWEDFMKYGHVRNESKLDDMCDLMINNICKVYNLTILCGHSTEDPEEYYHDVFDEYIEQYLMYIKYKNSPKSDKRQLSFKFYKKLKVNKINNKYLDIYTEENDILDLPYNEQIYNLFEELKGKFLDYYVEDPNSGQAYISDYALDKLMELAFKLYKEKNSEKRIVIMDQMLNVVHQRSDIAGWFVQGGSKSLNKLSGYGEEDSKLGNYD